MMDRFVIPSSFGCQAGHQLRRSRSLGGRDVPERGQHLLPGLGVAGVNQHGQDDQPRHRHGGVIVSGSWSVRPGSWPSPRSVPRRDQRAGPAERGAAAARRRGQERGGPRRQDAGHRRPAVQTPNQDLNSRLLGRPLGALFSGPFSLTRCNASSPTTSPPRSPRRRPTPMILRGR
jgi:hypothetical protein